MKLPTPDPGTHWEFERGGKWFTGPTGYIPRFNLVDSATGNVVGEVYPEAYLTKFGVRQKARRVIHNHRETQKREIEFIEIEAQYPPRRAP